MKKNKRFITIFLTLLCLNATIYGQNILNNKTKKKAMTQTHNKSDETILYELNIDFIKNFTTMDTVAHNEIIHKDFVCVNGDGSITTRSEYMKSWATGYMSSRYTSFSITDENIRIFGNMALVRSRTVYTKIDNGETVQGSSVYTDTYIKENERWWCVQAHITPVKNKLH